MSESELSMAAILNSGAAREELRELCRRWRITELAVFGSALRPDFSAESDLDFLVEFAPEAAWSLIDHMAIERELETLLGRRVDLVTRRSVEGSTNWIRRREILSTARPLYAA